MIRGSIDGLSMGTVIPVFPLTGSLLLPGTYLPLNIFEARYRNLVEEVLDSGESIGMIQPRVPSLDNLGIEPDPLSRPALYGVGCLGSIERSEEQPDGRYLIVLKGLQRYRVVREASVRRGYRRVIADLDEFASDLEEPQAGLDSARLLAAIEHVGREGGPDFDLDVLGSLPGVTLLNALCAALPLAPAEKQALLEAADSSERHDLLLQLLGMGLADPTVVDLYSPPVVH